MNGFVCVDNRYKTTTKSYTWINGWAFTGSAMRYLSYFFFVPGLALSSTNYKRLKQFTDKFPGHVGIQSRACMAIASQQFC